MILSIITPVYNTMPNLIKECLVSIEAAKINYPYEVILINDGSTNEEVNSFLNNYKAENTTVIFKESNTGLSDARNVGIEKAKGKFILCLDSDDVLLPEINNAIKFLLKNKKYDIVYCDTQFFGDNNTLRKRGDFSKFKMQYLYNFITATALYRKDISGNGGGTVRK
ncbi:MAG: glycosyltransferase [Cruoricaptor ignavus]|nr:glycosyltransferase [Cruoricaptor ignavus]